MNDFESVKGKSEFASYGTFSTPVSVYIKKVYTFSYYSKECSDPLVTFDCIDLFKADMNSIHQVEVYLL